MPCLLHPTWAAKAAKNMNPLKWCRDQDKFQDAEDSDEVIKRGTAQRGVPSCTVHQTSQYAKDYTAIDKPNANPAGFPAEHGGCNQSR
jgi:hypothetical protein